LRRQQRGGGALRVGGRQQRDRKTPVIKQRQRRGAPERRGPRRQQHGHGALRVGGRQQRDRQTPVIKQGQRRGAPKLRGPRRQQHGHGALRAGANDETCSAGDQGSRPRASARAQLRVLLRRVGVLQVRALAAETAARRRRTVIKAAGQRACAAACVASSCWRAAGARGVCGDSSAAAAHFGWAPTTRPADAGNQARTAAWCSRATGAAEAAARRRRTSGGRQRRGRQRR